MLWTPIEIEELVTASKRAANWKAPGLDCLPNFWLKYLSASHCRLVKCFNDLVTESAELPAWLVTGSTRLIPKQVNQRIIDQ